MSTLTFWDNILESGETLLWTGRPRPRFHWRNWPLFAPAPLAALGLFAAFVFARVTVGPDPALWLFAAAGLLVYIPLRATRRHLATYATTRYAMTDRRALFFQVEDGRTRVKAYPKEMMTDPSVISTSPASVNFIPYESESKKKFGFAYIDDHADLVDQLVRLA